MMLTVRDVAQRLNVSSTCVYSLIASRKLTHIRVGLGRGAIRVREEDLDVYVSEQCVNTAPRPTPNRPRKQKLKHIKLN